MMTAAASNDCQKKTSPRTSSIGTPTLSVRCADDVTNVAAYTNSCSVSVKVNTITATTPDVDKGKTTLRNALKRLKPSTIAASSRSRGIDLKKPISSQVENGIDIVGYTKTSAQSVSFRCNLATIRKSGIKRSEGGTR